jgi:hypothetical protein
VLPERQVRAPDENPMRATIMEALSRDASPAPLTSPTALTPLTPPAAPARDFQRVANSIVRDVVSAGVFKGKSKQLYDFLYLKTRGAITPVRSKRIRKDDILQGAHIGSERTLYKNLRLLSDAGLVTVRSIAGEQDGSEYTVFLPEEVAPLTTLTPPTPVTLPTDTSHPSQKVVSPLTVESGVSGVTQSADFQRTSGEPKTSFKTKEENTDDELRRSLAPLLEAAREVTGREASDWGELAELLATELKIAAGRTESVSNVPAFLAEHLRRRLWKKDRRQIEHDELQVTSDESGPKLDISKCPDCFGTGMFYPEGFDKGVAKCGHDKLTKEAEGDR